MKLITTIYLAIGFILVTFCVVTIGYITQTKRVRASIEEVLFTSNVIREAESAQKFLVDRETGLRGYLLTGNEKFLQPYYSGRTAFVRTIRHLDTLTKGYPVQNNLVHLIEKDAHHWLVNFAEPLRKGKANAKSGTQNKVKFDSLFTITVQQGVGKRIIDQARKRFDLIEMEEEKVKQQRLQELNNSLQKTNTLAIGLTLFSIMAGSLTAFLLGKTIRKRFCHMTDLANNIANGNYNVSLTDLRHDEISTLTHSLNTMAGKLQASFTHLTKMNRELDQFAYVVSHDLKAPLRAINNLAEWIAEDLENREPGIIQNLSILRGRVQRMENLINGILDYSKVGRKEFPQTTFSTQEIIKEALENLSPPAFFEIVLSPALPVITGERTLFYQVISNLLSNAFKYHHKQTGTIEIDAKEFSKHYQFEIKDDGPGIPKEFHAKVFGIFQTMEARDVKESTGIGLAIVKKIIEEKGGSIWIDTKKEVGTTFLFTWPKEPVEKKPSILRS